MCERFLTLPLKKHGESIYGTRGLTICQRKMGGGSTHRRNKIWLHVFEWSGDTLRLPPIEGTIQSAIILDGANPEFVQTPEGLEITLPKAQQDSVDTVIELTLALSSTGDSSEDGHSK